MDTTQLLTIFQIGISILLIIAILLQQRGGGLSATFGGADGGGVYRTRRGAEKFIFIATIVLAVFFIVTAFLNLLIS